MCRKQTKVGKKKGPKWPEARLVMAYADQQFCFARPLVLSSAPVATPRSVTVLLAGPSGVFHKTVPERTFPLEVCTTISHNQHMPSSHVSAERRHKQNELPASILYISRPTVLSSPYAVPVCIYALSPKIT